MRSWCVRCSVRTFGIGAAFVIGFERVVLVARSLLGSNGSIPESKRSSHVLGGFERGHSREFTFVVRSSGVRTSLHRKGAFE